jgi:transcriptional regulator with XRE-family HTH domain
MTLGDRIRILREEKGLSQDELAIAAKTTKTTVSRYENNLRQPRVDILSRIAEALDANVDLLNSSRDPEQALFDLDIEVTEDKDQYSKFMERANTFFMNDEVAEEDKETFFRDISNLYWHSREKNRQKDNENKGISKNSK